MVREDTWYDFNLLIFTENFSMALHILENIPHALEKHVYSTVVGWSVLWMSVGSSWFIVMLKSSVSLLIFCLVSPSII